MENKIIIDGKLNSSAHLKFSKITNRPYVNFSIYVEPDDRPPFYFRCFASGDLAIFVNKLTIGQKIQVSGSIESALLADDSYGKQITCIDVLKI